MAGGRQWQRQSLASSSPHAPHPHRHLPRAIGFQTENKCEALTTTCQGFPRPGGQMPDPGHHNCLRWGLFQVSPCVPWPLEML